MLLAYMLTVKSVQSCTVVYVYDGQVVLAGANEDWCDSQTRFWIFPAEEGKRAWIKFGFAGGFPQAGMNQAGLFWDATSCPWLDMPESEEHKIKLEGPVMQKVITECQNIDEANELLDHYYCEDQYRAQYLIGDSLGHSVIVEGDNVILNDTGFQVLTNFYQSCPELGGYPCWRYELACQMLNEQGNLNVYKIGQVLDATHQDGSYPTQYSVVYDLKALKIYVMHFHNYLEFVEIDLGAEIQEGIKSYGIPDLFSSLKLISPAYASSIERQKVMLKWTGVSSSTYEVIVSCDPEFSGSESYFVNRDDSMKINSINLVGLIIPSLLVLLLPVKGGKKMYYAFLLLAVIFIFESCSKDEEQASAFRHLKEFSFTLDEVQQGVRYFWKVKAYPVDQTDFNSESPVFYFDIY